ncbi:group II truncated hemoglobin [Gammaproteobacteria bacterium]|nr:group II truncated hemoglobin [Gammaproteobacteria bacterium]
MSSESKKYGIEDHSYKAAGGLSGITQLVNSFYDFMEALPEATVIRSMHPSDLIEARKKLRYFLSGWLGGPKLYSEHYGSITIPSAHKHLPIGYDEMEAWILCMQKAADEQPYEESFRIYLIEQLRVPAERIKEVCNVK